MRKNATQFFRKIYLSLQGKGCVWEGVRDRTDLQHIDRVSFPFSWAAQPGAWGPSLSGTCSSIQHLLSNCNCSIGGLRAHSAGCWLSLPHLVSNSSDLQLTDFLSSSGLYNKLTSTLLPARIAISHSFNPSTVKVIISWYSSTGCTCYLQEKHFLF